MGILKKVVGERESLVVVVLLETICMRFGDAWPPTDSVRIAIERQLCVDLQVASVQGGCASVYC